MADIFSIDNYSVIEDDNNYYFFRCLEDIDIDSINNGKIKELDRSLDKLITYREQYNETHDTPSRFDEKSEVSLDEMWSHIKKNFYKGTNCVSFSTNCNVSIDYDSGNSKYLMIKVPKTGNKNILLAGQYMISELNKYIENVINTLSQNDETLPIIEHIKKLKTSEELRDYLSSVIKDYKFKDDKIIKRLDDKQFFNKKQQLEYDKIIAKLSVLELFGKVENILPRTNMNTSLISTISMAYSSGEVIVYNGEIPKDNLMVSKTIIDLFALLQQAEDKDKNNKKIKELKRLVLKCAIEGYDLINENGILYFGNGNNKIKLGVANHSLLLPENDVEFKKQVSLRDIYDLTHGQIPFHKANTALEFTVNSAKSKIKTYELCNILRSISKDMDVSDVIDKMEKDTYAIDPRIINRRNNQGTRICESVNIDMNNNRQIFNKSEQERMLSYINRLSGDNLRFLISSDGLKIEKNLCESILDSSSFVGMNEYYATTIIDQIDFYKIFNEERDLTEKERKILISKLSEIDCYRLYTSFEKLDISRETINNIMFNLLVENGFKDYTLSELATAKDLDEIVKMNISNFNTKITPLRVDSALGIIDNDNKIPNSNISLRDYQKDAYDSINTIFEEKRFAGVILPTGTGKSFVAMAEMLKNPKSNIIYYAPNTGILGQFKKHILRNIMGLEVVTDADKAELINNGTKDIKKYVSLSEADDVIKTIFPHLKLYCYQGLINKDEEFLKSHDADLIIFDELHRTGATEWNSRVKRLIKNNPNAKLLGITATPVRDDAFHKDMMAEFAVLSGDYTPQEILQKRYLATELYLTDAMQEGLVIVPNLITFDYTLENTDQFKEMEIMREKAKSAEVLEKIDSNYKKMLGIIQNSSKKGMSTLIKEAIEKNGKRENGKYIIFIPMNSSGGATEEYIKNEMAKVKEYFSLVDPNPEMSYLYSFRKDGQNNDKIIEEFEKESDHLKLIFALNMLNEGVHVEGLDGIMMLRAIGVNSKILYSQQVGRVISALSPEVDIESVDSPLIFDVYNNYISHNMDREVNKTTITSDLQKMRQIASWIRKHGNYFPDINSESSSEYRKANTLKKIKTKYTKYLDHIDNSNITKNELYEIEEILKIGKTIDLWDRDIGDRTVESDEGPIDVRVNTFKVTGEQKKFLDLYKEVKEIKSAPKVNVGKIRIVKAYSTLELLSEYGVEINNDTIKRGTTLSDILATLPKDAVKLIKEELQVPLDYDLFEEYNNIKRYLYARHPFFADQPIKTLRLCGLFHPFLDDKDRYKKIVDERGFITHAHSSLMNYNIYTGTKFDPEGYDNEGIDETLFEGNCEYNKHGFDRKGIHIYTKTCFDERGFDERGYYYALNEEGVYVNKGKYDDNGFDVDHLWHKKTVDPVTGKVSYAKKGTEYDEDGFDYLGLNKFSFDREGYYHNIKYNYRSTGAYTLAIKSSINTYKEKTPRGFDMNGLKNGEKYDEYGFDIFGYYLDNTLYNEYGFNCNLTYKKTKNIHDPRGFDFFGKNMYTKDLYDSNYFDRDGYLYRLVGDKYVKTDDRLNEYNFDCDGYLWEKDSKGYLIKTDSTTNPRGFKLNLRNKGTGEYFDKNYFDIDGYLWVRRRKTYVKTDRRINDYNFDCDGYYYKNDENGNLIKTNRRTNDDGFTIDKINVRTKELWDENGLDMDRSYQTIQSGRNSSFGQDGYYWEKQEDGTYKKTNSKYDESGRDKDHNPKPFEKYPDAEWDEYGRDKEGSYRTIEKKDQFDNTGFYWKYIDRLGIYRKTDKKFNPNGFNAQKINIRTNELWDEKGLNFDGSDSDLSKNRFFDSQGYFWKCEGHSYVYHKNVYSKTDRKVNDDGFNAQKTHIRTKELWDEKGLDIDKSFKTIIQKKGIDSQGYFWKKQENDTYIKTAFRIPKEILHDEEVVKKMINSFMTSCLDLDGKDENGSYRTLKLARFFDAKGYFWEKQEDGAYRKTDRKINERLFNKDFIHQVTGTKYDECGFDIDFINKETKTRYDRHGFDYAHQTEDKSIYNAYDFKYDGIHKNGTKYDDNGFDIDGIDKDTGLTYNTSFLNRDGKRVFDPKTKGYTKVGDYYLDKNGFDLIGFYYKIENGIAIPTNKKVNERGFNKKCIHEKTKSYLDENGFTIYSNFYPSTRYVGRGSYSKYDLKFFDADGYYYKEEFGKRVKTDNKFNEQGFDRNGNYWEKQEDGTYKITDRKYNDDGIDFYGFNKDGVFVETGLFYDRNHFDANGIHTIFKGKRDENGFDRDGRRLNGDFVDAAGFYQNGINYETGTRYSRHNVDIFNVFRSKRENNYEVNLARDYFKGNVTSKELYATVAKGVTDKQEQFDRAVQLLYKAVRICPELKKLVEQKIEKIETAIEVASAELGKLNPEARINQNRKINNLRISVKFFAKFR